MIPETGQRFGPYEILGELGGGGMGLVFRAWDERLHREVAVKLLHGDYKMPQMRERFLQEARAASGLNHPNICTVFDIGEQDGNPYFVMELLEGETLKDRIGRAAIPVEEIVRHGQEIATALAVAHAKGIVHRDIKPANIFLVAMPNGKSQAKVLDFGLAKIGLEVRGGWQSRMLDMTLAGATVGTLAYMSPEQARGESLDARSDLFSLGIVMYEMATRQVPFKGTTSELVFAELFHHVPESILLWNESAPRELERVVFKLLAKDRKGRFQTAKELHESLGKIADKLGKGGWLRKGVAAAVPLVQAPDPVARHRRQKHRTTESGGRTPSPGMPGAPISSADNMMIRPARMTETNREWTVSQPVKRSALAMDSEAEVAPLYSALGVPAQSDSSAAAAAARASKRAADALAVRGAAGREAASARSRSGVTRPGYGLSDSGLQAPLAEEWGHDSVPVKAAPASFAKRNLRAAVAVALLVLIAVGVFLLARNGLFRPMVLGPKDRLLLTVIQNKTGDKGLDGTVMQGLEIALRQSNALNVFGGEAYRAGLRQIEAEGGGATAVSGQRVAEKVGARAYVYGEIKGSGAPYTISVDVLQVDTNDKVASLEETVREREQIPAAIGRLAQTLRAEMTSGVVRRTVPLEEEATANVNALHAFAVGEAAMRSGETGEALEAYRSAAALDPKFAQAQMRLAWLYRSEKAEVASANAAALAQDAAEHGNDKLKLMAQFCYEVNASGNYGLATETIRRYVAKYPRDVEGMKGMARVMRLQGHLPEALLAAQRGYEQSPFDEDAYAEAELALISMDRYEAAFQLKAQARRVGVREDMAQGSAIGSAQMAYEDLNARGLSLDSAGRMDEGLQVWRMAAAKAGQTSELVSTQASLLAQGALDRALTESCTVALEMVNEARGLVKGPVASFNAGMAAALCGDQTYTEKVIAGLQQSYPQSTEVTQYYVPELEAAADIGVNEPVKALPILMESRVGEQSSLIPYLRGLAHLAVSQMPLAIADFQTVLAHKGMTSSLGGTVAPMAEIGLARAYAGSRDRVSSVATYRQFLTTWSRADHAQPRMIEAIAKSR